MNGYSVLVSSKDYAREDREGEFVDYVSLLEAEFATLDEATAVAFDVLHKARAEDTGSDCYLGAFIDSLELREDGQPVELWAIDETTDNGFVAWKAGEGR